MMAASCVKMWRIWIQVRFQSLIFDLNSFSAHFDFVEY